MQSSQEIIQELENKRRALNERLMNSKDLAEANSIERELWALRAAIRHHNRMLQMKSGNPPHNRSDRTMRSTEN